MPEPLRRKRATVSCVPCRRKKLKCDRKSPCSNCIRTGKEPCVYEKFPAKGPRSNSASERSSSFLNVSMTSDDLAPRNTPLSIPTPASTSGHIETINPHLSGTFHVHRDSRPAGGQAQGIARSVSHKTRLFGQSHWFNSISLFGDLVEILVPLLEDKTTKAFSGIRKCKSMVSVIKKQRTPSWPTPTVDALPQRDLADTLLARYMCTIETVYRVLHVPSFRRDYDRIWNSTFDPTEPFVILLKLVLALGAATLDDTFSLRTRATRWVYEAQTWLQQPNFKPRMTTQALQINILLLIAREILDVGGDQIWISAGSLLRRAMHMGLHRSPDWLQTTPPILIAEIRRRLWNTILEICLQSSLSGGGSPLISLEDFDTEAPGNFDDKDLLEDNRKPKPESVFTDTSIAIVLRKTYPVRLKVAKYLNGLSARVTYEEILLLDTELREAYRQLRSAIQGYQSRAGRTPNHFAIQMTDFIANRYIVTIHCPLFEAALKEAAYAYSRRVVVDTSLKLWYAACPSSLMASFYNGATASSEDDFARLLTCGSGFFRTAAMHSALLVAIELRTQIQESLGATMLRPDLLAVLSDAKAWSLQCIEAGETNIKGDLFLYVAAAQIEGLMRSLPRDEIGELLIKAVLDSEDRCFAILQRQAANGVSDGDTEEINQIDLIALNTPPDEVNDLGMSFMMPDAFFDFGEMDAMNYMPMFDNEDSTQGTASYWA